MAELSNKYIRTLKARKSPYRVADTGSGSIKGFGMQVSPTRNKSWYVRYRVNGK